MKQRRHFRRGYCFDFGPGWAVIDSLWDTSPMGVSLHIESGRTLNPRQCRDLSDFLLEAADWLHSTRRTDGIPEGTVVYAIADTDRHHKIGKAVDLAKRLKQLQTGNARRLVLVGYLPCSTEHTAYRAESAAHKSLSDRKTVGEWFECDSFEAMQALYQAAESVGCDETPVEVSIAIDSQVAEVANG